MKATFLVASGIVLLASAARADVAPKRDTKQLPYYFLSTVAGDSPDQVVFAYPCSGSNDAPGHRVTPLRGATSIAVGMRESCQIYVVDRGSYDAWRKDASAVDPPAESLIAKAKACTGQGPTPVLAVPYHDPRGRITDTVDVKVAGDACTMTLRLDPNTPPPPKPAVPEKKKGCNASGSSSFSLLLALPALFMLLKKRRG